MSLDVPSGWIAATVADVSEILDSKRVPLNSEERRDRKGPIPYWGANGIVDHIDSFIFDEPLVLMAEDGGYFDEAAKRPICHRVDGRSWVNNHAHVIRTTKVERDWFYYWFVHRDITPHIKGGTRSKLNQKDLKQLPIWLPPLPEQRRIAEILSSVDEVIQATEALIERTRKVKESALRRCLTKGLIQSDLHETEIGALPSGWEVRQLREISSILTGKTPSTKDPAFWGKGVPFVTPTDLGESRFCFETQRSVTQAGQKQVSLIPACSVLVTCIASIGKMAIASTACVTNQQINSVIPHQEQDSRYIYYAIQSRMDDLKRLAGKTAIPIVNKTTFSNFAIAWPRPEDRLKVADHLESIDEAISAAARELGQLIKLRSALMCDLLTGRKRVTDTMALAAE